MLIKFSSINKIKCFFYYSTVFCISTIANLFTYRETAVGLFRNQIPLAGDGFLTKTYLESIIHSNYSDLITSKVRFVLSSNDDSTFLNYPVGSLIENITIKLFSDLTRIISVESIIHIFSILKAGLIAVLATYVARKLNINRLLSFLVGLFFALNNFNLIRAEGHFYLGLSWSVPLIILIAWELWNIDNIKESRVPIRNILIALFIGLSGYYYALIACLVLTVCLILLYIRNFFVNREFLIVNPFRLFKGYLFLIIPVITGILIQVYPIWFYTKKNIVFQITENRNFTEPFIFSGNTESFFYDFNIFVTRLFNRDDISNFLTGRINWEASQIGALTGFLTLLLVLLGIIQLVLPGKRGLISKLDECDRFLLSIFVLFQLLYFSSPINSLLSEIIKPLRAWGRLSIFLNFAILLILMKFVSTLLVRFRFDFKKTLGINLILLLFLTFPLSEIYVFHKNRPSMLQLDNVANSQMLNSKVTSEALIRKKCKISVAPYYPFPEFDVPTDLNIDYDQLQIPLSSYRNVTWLGIDFKNSANWRIYSPLVSQAPDFQRVDLQTSFGINGLIGACNTFIDVKSLIPSEFTELNKLMKSKPYCVTKLPGEKFENRSRYLLWDLTRKACQFKNNELKAYVEMIHHSTTFWRVNSPNELAFESIWQEFKPEQHINVRLHQKNISKLLYVTLRIRNYAKTIEDGKICISEKSQNICKPIGFNKLGKAYVTFQIDSQNGIFDFWIQDPTVFAQNQYWSIMLSDINPKNLVDAPI